MTTTHRKKRAMRDHACDHPERSFLPIFWQMSFPTCSAATSARRAITSTVKTIHSSYLRATTDTLFDGLIDVANRPHNLRLLDHIAVTHYMLTEKQADAPPSSRFSPASSDWSYPTTRQRKTHHCPRSTNRSASPCTRLPRNRPSLLPDCRIHSS